ncbi:MAG: hypothetical protein Q9221_007728, partial [Calogaya cf. arnoldii]
TKDAWGAMTPPERLPYTAQIEEAIRQYKADIQAFNARIPLSPLVSLDEEEYLNEDTVYDEHNRKLGAQIWNRYRRDHPEACGGAVTPVPSQPFRFLHLPLKLRETVYGLILRVPKNVYQMEPDGSANDNEGPIDTRIFAVSKQIHQEATEAFFRENVVGIHLYDHGGSGQPSPMFTQDASDIQQAYIKKLAKVDIGLPMHTATAAPRLKWVLERVCHALAQCPRLEEVRITPCTPSSWYKPELDVTMDSILETVTLLRGVSSVRFSDQATLSAQAREPARIIGTEAQKERLRSIVNRLEG